MNKCNITSKMMEYLYYLKRKIFIKKINNSLLNNIEGIEEFNIPLEWFYMKKPKGISGVARLKNADNFLELCLESHLPFLDELILVDNESDDNTKDICLKLLKKYPDKIKFYEYPFQVFPPSCKNGDFPANSLHSLAYYYNWCFSKSTYSHVMKVDDDNFLVHDIWENIRNSSLSSNNYNIYRGLNLVKNEKGKIGIVKGFEFSGAYGDHGVYPVSPYTYYVQGKECEVFVNNLMYKRNGFSFFHLKYLKPNYGFHNINDSSVIRKYIPVGGSFSSLPSEFNQYLKNFNLNI